MAVKKESIDVGCTNSLQPSLIFKLTLCLFLTKSICTVKVSLNINGKAVHYFVEETCDVKVSAGFMLETSSGP